MKIASGVVVASLLLAWTVNGVAAPDQGAVGELLSGRFTRIALCGYGDGQTSRGIANEEVLRRACENGRDSFVVEVGGLAISRLELAIKRSLNGAQGIDGPGAADLPCMAMITIFHEGGKPVQLFVMSNGEVRSGALRVIPENRKWLRELTGHVCRLIE